MSKANEIFEKGQDVHDLFEGGEGVAQPEQVGTMGALGLGAASGATFGFDDEIAGITKAIFDKTTGDKKDFWDIYKTVRDSVRDVHKQAEEQHPGASLGGELIGGLGTALAMPVGAVAKGAGTLAKIAQMGKAGAAYGALSGLGGSTADLTEGQGLEAGKDIAKGAAAGAVTGAGMQAAGSTVAGLGKMLGEHRIPRDTMNIFKRTLAGEELTGPAAQNVIGKEVKDVSEGTINKVMGLAKDQGTIQSQSLKELETLGIKGNMIDAVTDFKNYVRGLKPVGAEKEDIQRIASTFGDLIKNGMDNAGMASPSEINSMIQRLTPEAAATETSFGNRMLGDIKEILYGAMEKPLSLKVQANPNGPEAVAFQRFLDTKKTLSENIYPFFEKTGIPKRFTAFEAEDKQNAIKKIRNLIDDFHRAGANERIDIEDALKTVSAKFPNEANDIIKNISNASDRRYLSEVLQRQTPFASKGVGALMNDAAAAKAGKAGILAAKAIQSPVGQIITSVGKGVYNLAPDALMSMAKAVENKGGAFGMQTAKTLRSVAEAPDAKRKALLFTLMQQPDFREFARSFLGEEQP